MASPNPIAIVGTTAWGTTLGIVLARRGHSVKLWARTEEEARTLTRDGENKVRLPGFSFPPSLTITSSLKEALDPAALVILAVPAQRMRENLKALAPFLRESQLLLSAAKGLELATGLRMAQVMAEELPPLEARFCVMSGPNLSREIAQGQVASTVIAARDEEVARAVQMVMTSPVFRVYTSTDMVGVELGGALKNVIALGAGMADALGAGNNAKAAFMARGLAEMTRLGVAAGARAITFAGLAGVGDLLCTCSSALSRNRLVGQELAKGRPLPEVLATLKGTAEGVDTTIAARKLAHRLRVDMPILGQTYRILFEGLDPRQAGLELLNRAPKAELAEIGG